jgi:hypothetical protein
MKHFALSSHSGLRGWSFLADGGAVTLVGEPSGATRHHRLGSQVVGEEQEDGRLAEYVEPKIVRVPLVLCHHVTTVNDSAQTPDQV